MQLDLFNIGLPTAKVYPFPEAARVSVAHKIAQQLVDLDYDEGKRHWHAVARDLRTSLRGEGLSAGKIRERVARLAGDVHGLAQTLIIQKQDSRCVVLSLLGNRVQVITRDGGAGAGMGRGAKLLAGFGAEPHEGPEQESARAREDAR